MVLQTGWFKTTYIYCPEVLGPGSLRFRCQQGWFPLRTVRENLFHQSFLTSGLLEIYAYSWFIDS